MSILSTQDLQDIQSAEDLQKIFVKLGYEDTYGELDIEDLELTETQASAVYRAYLIGSHENDALQVILFELKWNKDNILRQRLQAIAKSLSQRPTLFIVLGTTDYETLSLINIEKKFDAEMKLTSVIKETRVKLSSPEIFDVNLLESLATQDRKAQEIYQEQRQYILYSSNRIKEKRETIDSLGIYLREIGKIPLLTPVDEIQLSKIIQIRNQYQQKRKEITEILGRKPTNQEWADSLDISRIKLREICSLSNRHRKKLIVSNLRLVVSIAKKFTNNGLDLLDLIQEGNMGLIRASRKFNPEYGTKFSTYASFWIKQRVQRGIQNKSQMIRLPVYLHDKYRNLKKSLQPDEFGKLKSLQQISSELDMTTEAILQLKINFLKVISLSRQVGSQKDDVLENLIAEKNIDNLVDEYTQKEYHQSLIEFTFKALKLREKQILIYRYGLYKNNEHTLEEIGKKYGLTRERVRQIEVKAKSKICKSFSRFNKLPTLNKPNKTLRELLMVDARYRFIKRNQEK